MRCWRGANLMLVSLGCHPAHVNQARRRRAGRLPTRRRHCSRRRPPVCNASDPHRCGTLATRIRCCCSLRDRSVKRRGLQLHCLWTEEQPNHAVPCTRVRGAHKVCALRAPCVTRGCNRARVCVHAPSALNPARLCCPLFLYLWLQAVAAHHHGAAGCYLPLVSTVVAVSAEGFLDHSLDRTKCIHACMRNVQLQSLLRSCMHVTSTTS